MSGLTSNTAYVSKAQRPELEISTQVKRGGHPQCINRLLLLVATQHVIGAFVRGHGAGRLPVVRPLAPLASSHNHGCLVLKYASVFRSNESQLLRTQGQIPIESTAAVDGAAFQLLNEHKPRTACRDGLLVSSRPRPDKIP
jgi:hypothetical protein